MAAGFFPAGIQTDSVLSARLQIIRIYIREDGRLVIEFKTHAKFRGQFTTSTVTFQTYKYVYICCCCVIVKKHYTFHFHLRARKKKFTNSFFAPGQFVLEHHTLPGHKSHLMPPDHLGGIEFDIQLLWSAQTFDSPYQLWRATSSYSRSVSSSAGGTRRSECRLSQSFNSILRWTGIKILDRLLVFGKC